MQWTQLTEELDGIQLDEGRDGVSWALEANGIYSTHSMYAKLCQGQVFQPVKDLWKATTPLKIKTFVWQLIRGRLPSNDQIVKRKGPSDGKCTLCGQDENVNHIFFQCVLVRFMWSGVRSMLSVTWNPSSFTDRFNIQNFRGHTRKILWLLFSSQCWSLWLIRNKYTIEGKFPNQTADCVFKCLTLLQLWRPLQKSKTRELLDELLPMLKKLFNETRSPPQATGAAT